MRYFLCFFVFFASSSAYAAGWTSSNYIDSIYMVSNSQVLVNIHGGTNINNCSVATEKHQFAIDMNSNPEYLEIIILMISL